MLKNDIYGLPNVKWLHVTVEVDKSVRCSCQIFSEFSSFIRRLTVATIHNIIVML